MTNHGRPNSVRFAQTYKENRSEERSAGLSKIFHEMKGVRKTRRTVQRHHRSSSRRFQLRLSDGILQVRNELFDMGHGQPLN